jgi:hypothetical protein
MNKVSKIIPFLIVSLLLVPLTFIQSAPKTGPVIINKSLSDPSVNEPAQNPSAGYKQDVNSSVGKVTALFIWQGLGDALGSMIQPFAADPSWRGWKSEANTPSSTSDASEYKSGLMRLYQDMKGIGGKNVTDVAKLGQVCGDKPGDPYWVGIMRPGNVEYPPYYQIWHHQDDCYCRCKEKIACPIKYFAGEANWHRIGGGPATHNIPCEQCWGNQAFIRKHDHFVGKDHGTFPGYPSGAPMDDGYQECLRQSVESYSASGPGGFAPQVNAPLFGI